MGVVFCQKNLKKKNKEEIPIYRHNLIFLMKPENTFFFGLTVIP